MQAERAGKQPVAEGNVDDIVGDEPVACPEAVAAIGEADVVVIGPGSVLTSVLPNLLVPGIAAALSSTSATTVFVANLDEQQGEGEGRSIGTLLVVQEVVVIVLVGLAGSLSDRWGRPPVPSN